MYSAPWCRDCRETKRYLDSHGIAFTEIDIEANPAASEEVLRHVGKRAIPQLVLDGEWFQPYKPGRGSLYAELDLKFGIKTRLSCASSYTCQAFTIMSCRKRLADMLLAMPNAGEISLD